MFADKKKKCNEFFQPKLSLFFLIERNNINSALPEYGFLSDIKKCK